MIKTLPLHLSLLAAVSLAAFRSFARASYLGTPDADDRR